MTSRCDGVARKTRQDGRLRDLPIPSREGMTIPAHEVGEEEMTTSVAESGSALHGRATDTGVKLEGALPMSPYRFQRDSSVDASLLSQSASHPQPKTPTPSERR